jgi:hypothetical protein
MFSRVALGLTLAASAAAQSNIPCTMTQSVYSASIQETLGGAPITMDAFAGNVSLVINTATF